MQHIFTFNFVFFCQLCFRETKEIIFKISKMTHPDFRDMMSEEESQIYQDLTNQIYKILGLLILFLFIWLYMSS